MSMHITMNDENAYKKLKLYPHHRESELHILKAIGNPPIFEELATIWIKNSDLKKAIKALEDLT